MKNIFVCCDSFKGTLSSKEVNDIIYKGLATDCSFSIIKQELADGGEGSLSLIKLVTKHIQEISMSVYDPIGKVIKTSYLRNENIAYIEVAAASGIGLLLKSELDPLKLNSYGTGQLILHAINNGCTEIHLFLGGSATIDGGTGILGALSEMPFSRTNYLLDFSLLDIKKMAALLSKVQFNLICDVKNKATGDMGAVKIFGPQKGANVEIVEQLEAQMKKWLKYLNSICGIDLNCIEGLGAAGAIGLPFFAIADTKIVTGFSYFNELMRYEKHIDWCDVLITGEGCIDEQTSMGKGPGNLAKIASEKNKKVIGIGGMVKSKPLYFEKVFSTIDANNSKQNQSANAEARLIGTLQEVKQYLKEINL